MAWQYCNNCKAELNPDAVDTIRKTIMCKCKEVNEVANCEGEERNELLAQMYLDIQEIKLAIKGE